MIIVCFNDPDTEKGIFVIRHPTNAMKQEFDELASMDSSEGNMKDCRRRVNEILRLLMRTDVAHKLDNRYDCAGESIYFFSF